MKGTGGFIYYRRHAPDGCRCLVTIVCGLGRNTTFTMATLRAIVDIQGCGLCLMFLEAEPTSWHVAGGVLDALNMVQLEEYKSTVGAATVLPTIGPDHCSPKRRDSRGSQGLFPRRTYIIAAQVMSRLLPYMTPFGSKVETLPDVPATDQDFYFKYVIQGLTVLFLYQA